MADHVQYMPSPVMGARKEKGSDESKWTLILVRDLNHSPEKVWQALTDPAHLRQWAPFEAGSNLAAAGSSVRLTWSGTGRTTQARIKRAEEPHILEYDEMRWQLEPSGTGTRLTLWHSIDRRFIAWGAAGWHIGFDVLDRFLNGTPIGPIAGPDAMKHDAWQGLVTEYTQLLSS
jgi:uncharacterized protein YndB with AHSA1/START domain